MNKKHRKAGEAEHPDGTRPVDDTSGHAVQRDDKVDEAPQEIGGRSGPDPTRYGDWEKNGRCIDF